VETGVTGNRGGEKGSIRIPITHRRIRNRVGEVEVRRRGRTIIERDTTHGKKERPKEEESSAIAKRIVYTVKNDDEGDRSKIKKKENSRACREKARALRHDAR